MMSARVAAGKRSAGSGHGYCVYLLASRCRRRTYIGSTNDLRRRLRQHNGALAGGARATRIGRPRGDAAYWRFAAVVHGFGANHRAALAFEWAAKHPRRSRHVRHIAAVVAAAAAGTAVGRRQRLFARMAADDGAARRRAPWAACELVTVVPAPSPPQ